MFISAKTYIPVFHYRHNRLLLELIAVSGQRMQRRFLQLFELLAATVLAALEGSAVVNL